MSESVADLIAEVAAEHVACELHDHGGEPACYICALPWPCKPARLAAALSPENVAAGLRYVGLAYTDYIDGLVDDVHRENAAALLAAMKAP